VTAAALEVLEILNRDGIIEHCRQVGDYFKKQLLDLKDKHESIVDVRGMGLLLGMKMKVDGAPIVKKCMEAGFLINCIQDSILRFIPPLIIETADIDRLISCLDKILSEELN
jgi:acetylornithine/succinyldiaminopimelate/putrescine aminotransferase